MNLWIYPSLNTWYTPDILIALCPFYNHLDVLILLQDVMRAIQSKQSPVEDLLRQADDLIANQKPR